MKTKLGIALVAMIALAFVAAAPAAADVVTIDTAGETVFAGEEGLNFSFATAGTTAVWFPAGADITTSSWDDTYTIAAGLNNYIDPAKFATKTGPWYYSLDDAANPSVGDNFSVAFYAEIPTIDVKAYEIIAGPATKDRTDGNVITNSNLTFRVDTNLWKIFTQRAWSGDDGITITVKDEQGTKYTGLINESGAATGTTSIKDFTVASQLDYVLGQYDPIWYTSSANYASGVYTFYASCDVNDMDSNYGVTGSTVSKVYTVTIAKDTVTIEANKDTVVRNNDFSVTVTGRPNTAYALWIEGSSTVDQPPEIKLNQDSVAVGDATAGAYVFSAGKTVENDTANAQGYAKITTSGSGTRTIGFATNQTTTDQSYTIRVQQYSAVAGQYATAKYDKVKVKVEKGDVTITASGDASYFLGEEIILSGTNTDSDYVYLFITGPNLFNNGAKLVDPKAATSQTDTGDESTFIKEAVETDDTWEYKWDTSSVDLDAGTYTIYAVTDDIDKGDLGTLSATYATVSIVIKKPFVTATTSAATVAKGDDLYITGTAEGDPSNVYIWILGKNKALTPSETVEDDGTFEYKFATDSSLAAGQYFVVVQHPMYNGQQDVYVSGNDVVNKVSNVVLFQLTGQGSLQGSDAAEALVQAINSPNIDDTYYKLTFMVEEPWIIIDAIGDRYVGETFTITGTTNLAVGDSLIVEVVSSSFQPTEKTQSGAFSGASGTVLVTEGDDGNAWEFAVDASNFKPDEYIVKVEAVEADNTATQTFNVLKAVPTAEPTEQPTAQPTAEPTAEPTEEPTPEPTATPGFGAVFALIGLGAVAALVLRKD